MWPSKDEIGKSGDIQKMKKENQVTFKKCKKKNQVNLKR